MYSEFPRGLSKQSPRDPHLSQALYKWEGINHGALQINTTGKMLFFPCLKYQQFFSSAASWKRVCSEKVQPFPVYTHSVFLPLLLTSCNGSPAPETLREMQPSEYLLLFSLLFSLAGKAESIPVCEERNGWLRKGKSRP